MRNVLIISALLLFTSCLKKIEEVSTANTNIFDPEYAGDQWWNYDDVSMFTNQNNDTYIKIEFSAEDHLPELKPTSIDVQVIINDAEPLYTSMVISPSGDLEGVVNISPTGATNFCVEIGVYIEDEQKTINSFKDCKSL